MKPHRDMPSPTTNATNDGPRSGWFSAATQWELLQSRWNQRSNPRNTLDSGFRTVFWGGSCFDIFWYLVTCFDSWTFFLSLSFLFRDWASALVEAGPRAASGAMWSKHLDKKILFLFPTNLESAMFLKCLIYFVSFWGPIYQYISNFVSF